MSRSVAHSCSLLLPLEVTKLLQIICLYVSCDTAKVEKATMSARHLLFMMHTIASFFDTFLKIFTV